MSGRHSLRRLVPWLVLLIGWLATGLIWQALRQQFEADARAPLQHNQDSMLLSLSEAVGDRLATARQLAWSMAIAPGHAGKLFEHEGKAMLRRFPDLVALEWATTVPDSARQLIEQSLSASSGQFVTIKDYEGPGHTQTAPDRPRYLIVQQVLPADADQSAIGLDLYSVPFWQQPLTRALQAHQAQATSASLVQNNGQQQYAVRVFVPISSPDGDSLQTRSLLSLVFKPDSLAAGLLKPWVPDGVTAALFDLDQFSKQPLFAVPENSDMSASSPYPPLRGTLLFAGRHWMLQTTPSRRYLLDNTQLLLETILLSGLILSTLAALLVGRLTRALALYEASQTEQEAAWRRDRQALQNKEIEKAVLVRALGDSEQRTRDFIDLAVAFSCELDENGEIGFISPQIHDILGIPPASLAHKPLTDLLPESEKARFEAAIEACRRERHSVRIDTWMNDRHGEAQPIGLRLRPVSDTLNQCLGFRAVGWSLPSVVLDQSAANPG